MCKSNTTQTLGHEALIEMIRGTNEKIYKEYRNEVCNKKGEVQGTLQKMRKMD